ncbi:hypothetical protein [Gordonia malaquae]|uniref:hypothetical protein n=1 Tax=Gordonia malaquae TaxID=410332 RepID=UPI003015FF62
MTNDLCSTPLTTTRRKPRSSTTAATPAWQRRGQPTWCTRATHAGSPLPSIVDDDGNRSLVGVGVDVPLVRLGMNADGFDVWQVPASAWSPGDTITVGPLPEGVRVEYEIDRPHHPSNFHIDGTYIP